MTGIRGTSSGMRKSDVTCPECNAGYRRIELTSRPGTPGEFRCVMCGRVIEVFDGSTEVALRLAVPPEILIRVNKPASVEP
jgi:transposase-like protein